MVEMGQVQKSAMETKILSACARDGWWQASLGQPQEQAIVTRSQIEKKGGGCSGRLFGKLRPSRSGY